LSRRRIVGHSRQFAFPGRAGCVVADARVFAEAGRGLGCRPTTPNRGSQSLHPVLKRYRRSSTPEPMGVRGSRVP
jgi:hypothetical protein